MKAKLIKKQPLPDQYFYILYLEGQVGIYAQSGLGHGYLKLSEQNCDEIFGVVDVEKLSKEYAKKADDISAKYSGKVFGDNNSTPFKDGFNKAMELNKDKLFTLEDMKKVLYLKNGFDKNGMGFYMSDDEIIQSLQQPTEIEVTYNPDEKDSDGCLILKKI